MRTIYPNSSLLCRRSSDLGACAKAEPHAADAGDVRVAGAADDPAAAGAVRAAAAPVAHRSGRLAARERRGGRVASAATRVDADSRLSAAA